MARRRSSSAPSGGRFSLYLALGLLLVVADQVVKHIVQRQFEPWTQIPVFPGLNWVLAHNTGAAFSFLSDAGGWQRWLFAGLAIVVASVVLVLLKRFNHRTLFALSLTCIAAGAIGNVIDRLTLGYVIDFIDVYAGAYHWPAFNIADILICCGAAGLVYDEIRGQA